MTIKTGFYQRQQSKADTVIAGVFKGKVLTGAAEKLNGGVAGLVKHHLENQGRFTGKTGQTLSLTPPRESQFSRIVLVGLGEPDKLDARACEIIGGKLFVALKGLGARHAALFLDEEDAGSSGIDADRQAAHVAAGIRLRAYKFAKYKTKKDEEDQDSDIESLQVITGRAADAGKAFESLEAAIEGVYWARDLVNEPPNNLYPDSFAQRIRDELKPLGVEIEILDEKRMEKMGFHAHLAVGMGSDRPPRVAVMRWKGAAKGKQKEGPLAFVGKGVTFDTGGINIKPSNGMEEMKLDMAGAAAVAGVMKAVALRKARADVIGIAALAENMPSHKAYRPSDIIDSMSGQTIEVLNTDAEGRLVLADALTYVQRTYKPRLIVDLATLTGAMMTALGFEYCGTFSTKDDLWQALEAAGREANEKLWRMPLDDAYSKEMDSAVADIKNLGSQARYAGACTAAAFLQRFIENDTPWAHMDIAGVAWIKADTPTCPKPGTGFGVRTLDRLVAAFEK